MRECLLYGFTACICFTICSLAFYHYRGTKYDAVKKRQHQLKETRDTDGEAKGEGYPEIDHNARLGAHSYHRGRTSANLKPPTLLDVASSIQSPVVLCAINEAFINITINFLLSIRRVNVTPNVLIVCEDRRSYDVMNRWGNITAVMTHLQLSKSRAEDWRSKAYNKLVDKRVPYIIELLKTGKDVFFMDTDIVWLADPFPYVSGGFDIAVIHDYPQNKENRVIYCAGYAFFRNTPSTRSVVDHWQQQLISPKRRERSEQQGMFNQALRKGKALPGKRKLKLKVLPRKLFQAGFEYFNYSTPLKDRRIKPVMIHNNWIVGLEPKLERYKQHGLWYLEDDSDKQKY